MRQGDFVKIIRELIDALNRHSEALEELAVELNLLDLDMVANDFRNGAADLTEALDELKVFKVESEVSKI
jgi:hypothetical protein